MRYEEDVRARSYKFRDEYVDATPWWYRGEMHLGFTLLFTGGVIVYCLMQLHAPTLAEWLAVIPLFLFGNWAEWAAHRYVLHRPTKYFSMIYKRHCAVHHRFFTHVTLEYKGHRHWRALLFPPFAPVAFVLAAVPFALVIGFMFSRNAGYIALFTMAAYFLMYEGLHTLSHFTDSPFLDRVPLVKTLRRLHATHHDPEVMATQNFNLTFPICDTLFGTRSDAPRTAREPFEGNR
ncbi:sterol desaturase family protein [Paraburkholderia fungorum]|uniref:sterol desaturase family protein n=1 Tax=Paraburkholderia fungorum TaxID=134537 RepID=UPI0038BAF4E8